MSWNEVTLTKSGVELLSGMLNGAKLIITRAAIGDKTVSDALLPTQTEIFSPISAPALISGQSEVEGRAGTRIDIQIRNDGVLKTSRMRQVGIFAKTESHDEVLLGLLQDEIGEEIPAYSDFPEWLIKLSVIIGISRTNNISVVVDPHVFATKAELDELNRQISELDTTGISSLNIAIPISGWTADTDTGGVFIDITAEGVTENIIPIISIAPGDGTAAAKCGLSDRAETGNGYIRLFAKTAPEREINADVILLSPSKKISSGGESITKLLPATATRLGGVKIGSGVSVTNDGVISVATESISATDEDTENIIDEIFGEQQSN